MDMDLSTPASLTRKEIVDIASMMHATALESLFVTTNWQAPQAVFHGGTALSLARNSARFSEDLDFLVDEESAREIESAMQRTRKRMELKMGAYSPGCSIEMFGPKGQEVCAWDFRWSHPARRGKVKVKVEFYVTKANVLNAYKALHIVPTVNGPVGISTPLPVPELVSAWADKVKAIATRVGFKWRDAYDLSFIADCMRRESEIPDEDRIAALETTGDIYGKSLEDIRAGLEETLSSGVFDRLDEFREDMRRWFDESVWKMHDDRHMFDAALRKAKAEVEWTVARLSPEAGARP